MSTALLVTVIAVMGLAATLTIGVWRSLRNPVAAQDFQSVISRVTGEETLDPNLALAKTRPVRSFSWNKFWMDAVTQSGRRVEDEAAPGRFALGLGLVGAFFGVVVFPGGPMGAYLGIVLLALFRLVMGFEKSKRRLIMEKQMPILLSGLRSQINAGVTVQAAIQSIADDLPSPLGDEIRQVKADMSVGVLLIDSLQAFGDRSGSRVAQFLVSSIGVAIKSGESLGPQLITIDEIVQQRARIQGKIRSAVALAKPTAYLAIAAPPAMFAWFTFSSPGYLSFFFTRGLMTFLTGLGLYVAGCVITLTMVRGVERI